MNCRCVEDIPKVTCFLPDGMSGKDPERIVLTIDEFEAIRLADKEGLYHAAAAGRMNVSRQTFGRILEAAHAKVAEALVDGKKLCIEGGTVRQICDSIPTGRPDLCICPECGHETAHQKGKPCRFSICELCGAPLKRKGGCLPELNL